MTDSLRDLEQGVPFAARHIGVWPAADQQRMLETIGYSSMDDLLGDAIPASIREKLALAIPPAVTEAEAAAAVAAEEAGSGRGAGRPPLPVRGYGSVGVF